MSLTTLDGRFALPEELSSPLRLKQGGQFEVEIDFSTLNGSQFMVPFCVNIGG